MKKLINIFLPVILLLSFSLPVSAESNNFKFASIHGHLKSTVKFPGRSLEQVLDLYESIGVELDTSGEGDILKIENGVPEMSFSLSILTLKMDGKIIETDDGEFLLDGLIIGAHQVQVYYMQTLLYEQEIFLEAGMNHLPLDLELDFNNLVYNAGLKMSSDDLEEINSNLITPFYDPDSYYKGIKVGEYFGVPGYGRMKMLTPEGHVSCNKSDYDQGGNFPFNNSDCVKAVAGGVLFSTLPIVYPTFYQGAFCVQEAMSSGVDKGEANSYCNHKPKSFGYHNGYLNKGYNCSSFIFLNGDERLNKY